MAGELFLATHQGFHRQALLPTKARDEGMSAGELLFDKLPGTDDSANEASKWEVQMPMCQALQDVQQDAQAVWLLMTDPVFWQCPGTTGPLKALEMIHTSHLWDDAECPPQAKSKVMMERLQPLSEEATQAVCSQWLSQTAGSAQGAILQLLQACRDASELAAAETKLRTTIQDWRHTPQANSLQAAGARLITTSRGPILGACQACCPGFCRACLAHDCMAQDGPTGSHAGQLASLSKGHSCACRHMQLSKPNLHVDVQTSCRPRQRQPTA